MAFTKINAAGIGTTETVTVDGLTVINNGSFGGNLTVSGVLTYEDVTNVDSVGLITARNGVVVGSGITLSKDGDIFATGITTVSGNVKVGTGITLSPDGDGFYTGVVTATTFKGDGSQLTGVGNTANVRTGILDVAGIATFRSNTLVGSGITLSPDGHAFVAGIATVGRQIVGISTNNLVPFLFNNYSNLPSASDYHGQFAHVHVAGKAFYAHAGAW